MKETLQTTPDDLTLDQIMQRFASDEDARAYPKPAFSNRLVFSVRCWHSLARRPFSNHYLASFPFDGLPRDNNSHAAFWFMLSHNFPCGIEPRILLTEACFEARVLL
jgi:hypothetical protein